MIVWDSNLSNGGAGSNTPPATPDPGKVSLVRTSGTVEYSTIGDALGAASSGDVAVVGMGTWNESVTLPDGVRLVGYPNAQNVVIAGADTTSTRITVAGAGTVREVTVVTPSSGANAGIDATGIGAGKLFVSFNVAIQGGGGTGAGLKGSGSGIVAAIEGFYHNGGTLGSLLEHTGGTTIANEIILNVGTSTDAIKISGSGTVQVAGLQTQSSALYTTTDLIDFSGTANATLTGLEINSSSPATNAVHVSGDGGTLYVAGSVLYSGTYDLLVASGLVGTGSDITIDAQLDFAKTSIPSGYRDVAETRLNFGTQTGWANYQDTTHTSGSPQAITATTRAQLTNNAGTKLENYRPGKAALWSSNKVNPVQVGEAYMIRLDFTIEPAQTNGVVTIDLDIGSDPFGASSIKIVEKSFTLAKGTAAQPVSIAIPIFCLSTFVANGGAFGITCDKNADVYDKSITIIRIH